MKQTKSPATERTKKLRTVLWWLAIVAPAILLSTLLAVYAVNVPNWDQWELISLFKEYRAGTLDIGDFYLQHNEHRLLFPRMIMFVLAVMTSWNVLYEIASSVVVACITLFFLYKILQKTFKTRVILLAAAVLTSAVLFSPIQWENWMWGWQVQWFLNVLGLVVAVWALTTWETKSPLKKISVAIAGGVLATFSLASGIFVWLVCVPIFVCVPELRRYIWLWIGAAVATIGAHYYGYQDPAYHPSKLLFLEHKLDFVKYLLIYISRPITPIFPLALLIAIVYLLVSAGAIAWLYLRQRRQLITTLLPWLTIALFALFADLSTTLSRLGFGLEQAFSSRYTTLSSLFLIAFLVILLKIIELGLASRASKKDQLTKWIRWAVITVVAGVAGLVAINYGAGIMFMNKHHEHLLRAQTCAKTVASVNDSCLYLLYPNPERVWEGIKHLREVRWGGL